MSGVAPDPAALTDLIAHLRSYTDTGDNESIGQQYARLIAIVPAERVAAMARGGFSWITTDDEEAIDTLLGKAADALEVLVARTTELDDIAHILAGAMQFAFSDYVRDTGCHPDCFRIEGDLLYADFNRGNFASAVAAWLSSYQGRRERRRELDRHMRSTYVPVEHAYGVTTEGEPE